jgi:DNA-binding response OmpR family regulator
MKVLVIEDNADAAESLQLAMQLAGHDVDVAHTGTEGVKKAGSASYDIVICDIGLPADMDGYTVARTLAPTRKNGKPVLIAMTGYGQDEDKAQASAAGFDHHLTKPIDPTTIDKLIARIGK